MIIAIKNPAPLGVELKKWGDYHFGMSLQRALEAHGVTVVQHYWPEWGRDDAADAVIVLRGKRRYSPPERVVSILWVLSHAATLTPEEIDAYTIACLTSDTLRDALAGSVHRPLEVLRQCTDTGLFTLPLDAGSERDIEGRRGAVFVANSRNVRREMIEWALNTGLWPELIGGNWDRFDLAYLVSRDYIDNAELPNLYRRARFSLNDHWGDMRYYGMINNRVFDCLAAGLPVLSDHFTELEQVCGDGVLYASDARDYWDAAWRCRLRYADVIERSLRCWERLRQAYSFDARAEQLIGLIEKPPGKSGHRVPPESGIPSSRSAALAATLRAVENEAFRDTPGGRLRMFHALPSVAGIRYLTESGRLDYLSGGIGPGPWEVFLDINVSQVPDCRFEVVVLEDTASLEGAGDDQLRLFLSGLVRSIVTSGTLYLVRSGSSDERLARLLGEMGLAGSTGAGGFISFARTGARDSMEVTGTDHDSPARNGPSSQERRHESK